MSYTKYINIIKTSTWIRQVQYTRLVIGEFSELQEAKDFAIKYEYGLIIKITDGEGTIETIYK